MNPVDEVASPVQISVLLVDDDEDDYVLTRELLDEIPNWEFDLAWTPDFDEAAAAMRQNTYQVYLVDYRLGIHDGLELLQEAVRGGCRRPVILLTGQEDRAVDVQAMQMGAADYLVKGRIDAQALERSIRYAVRHFNALEVLRRAVHENSLFATAIQNLTTGVVITDATRPENPILFYNPGFTEITGYPADELSGRGIEVLFGDETDTAEIARLAEAVDQGRSASSLLRCYRRDGEVFWNELSFSPIHQADGELSNFVELHRDVTHRKEAEEMRLAKQAAERANRAKSDFLAKMSHELRTPLNSVIGFTRYLLDNPDRDPEREASCLQRILSNGRHLLNLINEILDLAKIEAGELPIVKERFSLTRLVEETALELEGQMPDKPVELKLRLPPTSIEIETDRDKLKQILINLVANALKFTEQGSVQVRLLTDDEARPSRLEVADTGPGIPEDRQQQIMEPFQQGDDTIARRYGGSGLGLAICQTLTNRLGYRLDLESEVGHGSTFSIILS